MLYFIGHIWALPLTLIGVVFNLVTGSVPIATESGAILFVCRRNPAAWWFKKSGMAAYTLGACVCFARDGVQFYASTVRHELWHFRQARMWGIFFLPAYGIASLVAFARTGNLYTENWFEVDARKHEGK